VACPLPCSPLSPPDLPFDPLSPDFGQTINATAALMIYVSHQKVGIDSEMEMEMGRGSQNGCLSFEGFAFGSWSDNLGLE